MVFLITTCLFYCFVVIDLIISDLCYDSTTEPWDHQVTTSEISNFIKQADAANSSNNYTIMFWHKPLDTHLLSSVFEDRHISCMQHIYWCKPAQYGMLPVGFYTNSVEMATVGYHPNQKACRTSQSKDPRSRPNFFTHPSLTKLYKAPDGKAINPCQKPAELLREIVALHCPPGGN